MILEERDIEFILTKLLNGELTREDANVIATNFMHLSDEGNLQYSPSDKEDKIWDAVLFLLLYDGKIDPDTYLYSDEDLKIFIEEDGWVS